MPTQVARAEGVTMMGPDSDRQASPPGSASRAPDAPALRDWVHSIWTYTSDPADFHYERVMPTARSQLLLNLFESELRHWDEPGRPGHQVGPVGLQGALTRSVLIDSDQKRAVCGVSFRSGGAAAFHDVPAARFTNTIIDAADFWGDGALELHSKLCALDDPADRMNGIEDFLMERLRERPAEDRLVRAVSDALVAGRTVADVQNEAGLSRRGLHDLFERRVGVRPKLFVRLERFSAALEEAPHRKSWGDLAATTGFSDQAHLSREFVALAGAPPTRHEPVEREPHHAVADTGESVELASAGETFKRESDQ
jgi:AraC-like DNA-binding protein